MMLPRQRDALDALAYRAVDRENGFIWLRAFTYKGHANGLPPIWDGVTVQRDKR